MSAPTAEQIQAALNRDPTVFDGLDPEFTAKCRAIVKALELGASIRTVAATAGASKSTLHRWLPLYRAVAEATPVPDGTPDNGGDATYGAPTVPRGTRVAL